MFLFAAFPIRLWRFAAVLFKYFGKVALGGKSEVICYQCKRFIAVTKEALRLLYFFAEDEIGQRHASFLLEFGGQVRAADKQGLGQIIYVERS